MALDPSYILKNAWSHQSVESAPLPPAQQSSSGNGRTSIAKGFPAETSLPVDLGGIPPYREDFNGILRMITANLVYFAKGGMFNWDATLTYEVPCIVYYNGVFYQAVKNSIGVAPTNYEYWKSLDGAEGEVASIKYFACDTSKINLNIYQICDGRAISRSTYARLFNVIGTKYGAGDGSTTFNVPNLLNRVAWGSTSSIGSVINSGLPNIKGFSGGMGGAGDNIYARDNNGQYANGAFFPTGTFRVGSEDGRNTSSVGFDASRSNSIYGASTIVQPPAMRLVPCIHV